MYQGKLQQAEMYAQYAREEAQKSGNEKQIFKAELLSVMARMSGWYNIFFCIQDIPIHEGLIEKLMQNNYRNHLAHIYIYAYDNRPEMVARAYRSEASLLYFSKGVALAKEIGNEQLVYDAYQKNIMLASTNGMNEIAMLYSVRTYQFMKSRDDVYEGRILSGIGYNLSAKINIVCHTQISCKKLVADGRIISRQGVWILDIRGLTGSASVHKKSCYAGNT